MPSYDIFKGTKENESGVARRGRNRFSEGQEPDIELFNFSRVNIGTNYTKQGRYDDMTRRILDQYNKIPGAPTEIDDIGVPSIMLGMYMENNLNKLRLERMEEYSRDNPDAGIKTVEQLRQDQADYYSALEDLNAEADPYKTVGDVIMSFAGAIAGYTTFDAVNAISMVFGGIPIAGQVWKSAIKMAATEGAINVPLQLKDRPGEIKLRRLAGEELPTSQIVKESAIELGAVVGIGFGVGAGLGKFAKGAGKTKMNPVGSDSNVHPDVKSLAKSTPDGMTQVEHAKNLSKAIRQVINNEDVDVTGLPIERKVAQEAEQVSEQVVKETDEALVKNFEASVDDVVEILDMEGNPKKVKVKSYVRQATQELDFLNLVDKCVKGS